MKRLRALLRSWFAQEDKAEPMRLCRDCRYRKRDQFRSGDIEYDGCFAPQNIRLHPVSGDPVRAMLYCVTLRGLNSDSHKAYCGTSARWFISIQDDMSAKSESTHTAS